eukprot:scaffold107595_cov51-Prasinocladus_malaysianus.AAC.1
MSQAGSPNDGSVVLIILKSVRRSLSSYGGKPHSIMYRQTPQLQISTSIEYPWLLTGAALKHSSEARLWGNLRISGAIYIGVPQTLS